MTRRKITYFSCIAIVLMSGAILCLIWAQHLLATVMFYHGLGPALLSRYIVMVLGLAAPVMLAFGAAVCLYYGLSGVKWQGQRGVLLMLMIVTLVWLTLQLINAIPGGSFSIGVGIVSACASLLAGMCQPGKRQDGHAATLRPW